MPVVFAEMPGVRVASKGRTCLDYCLESGEGKLWRAEVDVYDLGYGESGELARVNVVSEDLAVFSILDRDSETVRDEWPGKLESYEDVKRVLVDGKDDFGWSDIRVTEGDMQKLVTETKLISEESGHVGLVAEPVFGEMGLLRAYWLITWMSEEKLTGVAWEWYR